jgi:hypothetical protein
VFCRGALLSRRSQLIQRVLDQLHQLVDGCSGEIRRRGQ